MRIVLNCEYLSLTDFMLSISKMTKFNNTLIYILKGNVFPMNCTLLLVIFIKKKYNKRQDRLANFNALTLLNFIDR